ncbi:sporulation protein YpjB [Gorillibacterium sp. CAU 1737]|uniref:sporulation protein YpjB n=1 Tax=Gorillibacterium sp. CAU 1737 TaxID=3140362 RepID=UPI0032607E17
MSFRSGFGKAFRIGCAGILAMSLLLAVSACGHKEERVPKGAAAVTAEEQAEVSALDQLAQEVERLTREGKIAEARLRLNQLGEQTVNTRFEGLTGLEGVRALSDAILTAQRAYNQARFSEPNAQNAIAAVRLITDAMLQPDAPLWHRSYKLLKDSASRLETAALEGDAAPYREAYADFAGEYREIRAAATVKTPMERIEKLDSLLVFLGKQGPSSGNRSRLVEVVRQVQEGIDELFERHEEKTAYLPLAGADRPLLWTFGIGSLLTTVLSFVGWRMYHSDRRLTRISREQLSKRVRR